MLSIKGKICYKLQLIPLAILMLIVIDKLKSLNYKETIMGTRADEVLNLPPRPDQIDQVGQGGSSRFFSPGRPRNLQRAVDRQRRNDPIIEQPARQPSAQPADKVIISRERFVPPHLSCMPENLTWAFGFLMAGAGLGQMLLIEYINRQQMKDMQATHIVGWDRVIYCFCFALSLATLTANYCCSVYRARMIAQEERRRLLADAQAAPEPKAPSHLNCMPANLSWAASLFVGGAGIAQIILIEKINSEQMKDMAKTHIVGWDRLIYSLCLLFALATLVTNYVCSIRKADSDEEQSSPRP